MNYCVKCLCKNSCRTGAAFRAKRPSPCPSPVRYVYSEVFDLKPTSELAQSWLKNPAHLSQIGFVLMVSAIVGMARCAVPARVVAGGTNIGATLAIERVAPLHAARTSQRDVPTTLNRYPHTAAVRFPHFSVVVIGCGPTSAWHPNLALKSARIPPTIRARLTSAVVVAG